ncbi:MAG: aminotransferase class III-fold pyridoxal phosphate-dependent enzyme [Acidobacteriota bacterium]
MTGSTDSTAPAGDVRSLLRDAYGVDGSVHPLAGEHDRNFRVDVAGAPAYVLKVMRLECDPALVEMQAAALGWLAERVPDVLLPRVVHTRDDAVTTTWMDEGGQPRLVWLLSYLRGRVLAEVRPHAPVLLRTLGSTLGRVTTALGGFKHPACDRELKWDPRRALWARPHVGSVTEPKRRALLESLLQEFERSTLPRLARVREGVVYADANDHNVIVAEDGGDQPRIGLVDFGDLHRTAIVADVAVAVTYAMLGKQDPFAAGDALVEGYDRVMPLDDDELGLIFPLVLARLAVSVVNSAVVSRQRPTDPYVTISEAPAWALLGAIADADPSLIEARWRAAAGRDPSPASTRVTTWLAQHAERLHPLLGRDLPLSRAHILDLSFESLVGGDNPQRFEPDTCAARIDETLSRAGCSIGVGRYGEPRPIYTEPAFGLGADPVAPRRTRHLGVDVFADIGTALHAPLEGEVAAARYLPDALDYGGMVMLRHTTPDGDAFHTLYGHLGRASVEALTIGRQIPAGAVFATIGDRSDNGNWPPHVHVQLLVSLRETDQVPNGVADPDDYQARSALSPCPAALIGLPHAEVSWREPAQDDQLQRRAARIAKNLKLSYHDPVRPVRAWRHLLYDVHGRPYLDAYNNVPHVGHAHPHVVEAVERHLRLLNTNTRYLHDILATYAERLTAWLPRQLSVCFFVNSGSEANELALRLARAHTGARDMLVMAHGYHGHTTGAIDISPYKFEDPRGDGCPPWVHVTPQPDVYHGPFFRDDPAAGPKFAAMVSRTIEDLDARGVRLAGYVSECLPSVGGQLVLPPGFLPAVYAAVRHVGGVCIADDVQTGLGRVGTHWWGFELQDVVPDLLVLGKPLGNGYPLGAVVTTAAIAASFAGGLEFFSTFGGSTVSCAAGLAVLDVLEQEALRDNAQAIGDHLLGGLAQLAGRHAIVGDVRGAGLFLGVELVRDSSGRTPATAQARYVVNRLRERRVLIGTEGPHDSVLKIRPPMTFDRAAADALLSKLDDVLCEDGAQP